MTDVLCESCTHFEVYEVNGDYDCRCLKGVVGDGHYVRVSDGCGGYSVSDGKDARTYCVHDPSMRCVCCEMCDFEELKLKC